MINICKINLAGCYLIARKKDFMNKVELMGRLVNDAELLKGKSIDYSKFTIAVKRKGKDEVDFINCTAFGKVAEAIVKYTEKGNRIIVEGSIQIENYETKEGNKVTTVNVIVNDFYFVDFKQKKGE